jgi:hypothetical protein
MMPFKKLLDKSIEYLRDINDSLVEINKSLKKLNEKIEKR